MLSHQVYHVYAAAVQVGLLCGIFCVLLVYDIIDIVWKDLTSSWYNTYNTRKHNINSRYAVMSGYVLGVLNHGEHENTWNMQSFRLMKLNLWYYMYYLQPNFKACLASSY